MRQQIKNYINYEIDTEGKIYNMITGQELHGSVGENGYRYYRLYRQGKAKMFYAHRLVAETFLENKNHLPVVNHIDGNKLNNNVNNLEWTSYSDNTKKWHNSVHINRMPTEYYIDDYDNERWMRYGNYEVSNYGRIKRIKKNNILKPSIASGYYKVRLSENGIVQDYLVHQLVYKLFSQNYDSTKVIDHIDGNKLNNHISNLRQLSNRENAEAALYETQTNSSPKVVEQYDLQGNLLHVFPSISRAAETLGLDSSTISKVCRGKNKTHGGFIFKYSLNKNFNDYPEKATGE